MNYHAAKAFILDKLAKELSPKLSYHGLHHTLDVLGVAEELCALEAIPPFEVMLVKTAALFHDSGFTIHNRDHETLGCGIAREALPRYGYGPLEIERICGMIMATRIPQAPQNALEAIICDADLDYLGREDFYPIGKTLFQELKAYDVLETEEDWNRLQVKFLENHHFHTAPTLRRRGARKLQYLKELRDIVSAYHDQ